MSILEPSIRRLAVAELEPAARVMRASYDERLPGLAGRHTPEEDAAFFRDHLAPTHSIFGALIDDTLVGVLAIRGEWVDQLYVLPESQGRGVGRALLETAKAQADRLSLRTFQSNFQARKFYEAQGFVIMEMTDGAENEEREPDLLLEWRRPSTGCASSQ